MTLENNYILQKKNKNTPHRILSQLWKIGAGMEKPHSARREGSPVPEGRRQLAAPQASV